MYTELFKKEESKELLAFGAASVHNIVMDEFVDYPLEVLGGFLKRNQRISVPPSPREVLTAIAQTPSISSLSRKLANESARVLSEIFPKFCDSSLQDLLGELAKQKGMQDFFAEVDATQDFDELKDWANRKLKSAVCQKNEDVFIGIKAATMMLEMGERRVYSTSRLAYRIISSANVSVFKDISSSTEPLAGSVARSDVKGAGAGAVAGCVGGLAAGGVGCGPGAATGAAVGGLAMSTGELAAKIWDSIWD